MYFSPLANTQTYSLLAPNSNPTQVYNQKGRDRTKNLAKSIEELFAIKEEQAIRSLLFLHKKSKTICLAPTWCTWRDFHLCGLPDKMSTGHFSPTDKFASKFSPYSNPASSNITKKIETFALVSIFWCTWRDLNPQPLESESNALSSWATSARLLLKIFK